MGKFFKKKLGMTISELLVAGSIFVMMMAIAGTSIFYIYQIRNKIRYTDELYTETRVLLDRIVREIRVNTVDYEEYFSKNSNSDFPSSSNCDASGVANANDYGKCAGVYEMLFYYVPESDLSENQVGSETFSWKTEDRAADMKMGYFNTKGNDTPTDDEPNVFALSDSVSAPKAEQSELYLISADGMTKTIIRKNNIGKFLEMKKMQLSTADENTGQRSWVEHSDFPDNGYPDYGFIRITPTNIDIESFTLFVSPQEDPYKGFAETIAGGFNPLIQPHVIVRVGAKISEERFRGIPGLNNVFELQTAATSRIFHDIVFPRP